MKEILQKLKKLEHSSLYESAPSDQEDWIKSNKQKFIKQYGKEKGLSVLYSTAWKRHNEKMTEEYEYVSNDDVNEIVSCANECGTLEVNVNNQYGTENSDSLNVSVIASNEKAEELLTLLKNAGLLNTNDVTCEDIVNIKNTKEYDLNTVINSGNDLNRKKTQHKKEYPGDNPIEIQLPLLKEFTNRNKITESKNSLKYLTTLSGL